MSRPNPSAQQFKVAYVEPVPAAVAEIARGCLPPEFELRVRASDEPVTSFVRDADFVLVATTPLPADVIAAATRARLIQHQGVGYEGTDLVAAEAHRIPVALCPTGTTVGVAEHTLLLILAVYKRLTAVDPALRRGDWLQWELRSSSYELAGKTLGLVGFGRIGEAVAKRARAFEARISYTDIVRAPAEREDAVQARYRSLPDLLAEADVVSLHLPLTPTTRHLIAWPQFELMKRSAVLINTARGQLVDEEALVKALLIGRIAGAGLDVFETEPLRPDHPLVALPNAVLTPHIAAGTVDALRTKLDACFANMLRVVRGEEPRDLVTASPLPLSGHISRDRTSAAGERQ